MADFNAWLSGLAIDTPNARHIDDDADGSYDCVDVAEDWAKACFPGVAVSGLLGAGNAKDLYAAANPAYFDKLAANIVSRPGDIPVWGATSTNAYGHIAVTINDDGTNLTDVEQNTYTQEAPTIAHRSHNNIIGFLRPKGLDDMTITDPIFRRIWSLSGFDTGPAGRQPTVAEVNQAVGRDFNEFMDYWNNTEPVKQMHAKAAYYDADLQAAHTAGLNKQAVADYIAQHLT